MKPWLLGFSLAVSLGWLLYPGLADAWTEADMQGARALLQGKLEQRRAAEAKAASEAKAKAEAEARARAEAKATAEAEAKARAESQAEFERLRTISSIWSGLESGMVEIPGGSFQMGCSHGDSRCYPHERDPHKVTVEPFRMGRYEVTQAQWQAVMDENPSNFKGDERRPVEQVSWNDVQTFLGRLNANFILIKPYRLPSEAEWEYAARAGTPTPYWWGKNLGKGNANCYDCGGRQDNQETAPVGSFKPNAFGLYDTVGNVREWVQDCWHDSYADAPSDGSAWGSDSCTAGRVLRGGSWGFVARLVRVSYRYRDSPDYRYGRLALRLAQDL